jgi:NADPH:quinone reductase-like Zn-dependent oxidoreductase
MKAVYINEYGHRDKLIYTEDFPKPIVKEAEVLIRIKATSVNPVDWKIREGLVKGRTPIQFPAILGWDMAGIVEETGFSVSRFKTGDEVFAYARRPVIEHGTYAEYISIPESYIAHKPKTMSFEEAASVPLVGLTAYQSLKKVDLQAGMTILILAATGGVGSMAIQLAKIMGAKVYGLASFTNVEYMKKLGADVALNYDKSDWVADFIATCLEKADVIFDCAGGETLQKSFNCIKPNGKIISITTPPSVELTANPNFKFYYHFVEPNAVHLSELANYTDTGKLNTSIHSIYTLQEIQKAHELSEQKHTKGKIVIRID